jgi:hypothetical protein
MLRNLPPMSRDCTSVSIPVSSVSTTRHTGPWGTSKPQTVHFRCVTHRNTRLMLREANWGTPPSHGAAVVEPCEAVFGIWVSDASICGRAWTCRSNPTDGATASLPEGGADSNLRHPLEDSLEWAVACGNSG